VDGVTAVIPPEVLGRALNAVENRELPLLSWGIVDNWLTEAEVRQAIAEEFTEVDGDYGVDQIFDALDDQVLIMEVADGRWRSRLAESLRLLVRSRQLFNMGNGDWWMRGRRLISDFRLLAQPRRYPKRNISAAVLLGRMQEIQALTPVGRQMLAAQFDQRPLAQFQVDATAAVLESLRSDGAQAVIVAAGTGSGKTLAFYLPAYLWMAEHLGGHQVQTLALYPRNELLKDQVGEALRMGLGIAPALATAGRRPLRLGALYGDTPWSAAQLDRSPWLDNAWRRVADGRVCPYATCPTCGRDLVWTDQDRRNERERLVCMACGTEVPGDILALTRAQILDRPPDVLFSSTEMLNRVSSDPRLGGLYGFTPSGCRPRLLLLDEVHTYEGVHGAQVALLVRRWRNAVGPKVTVVGLSATLRDAGPFMARLVGIPDADVTHIEPAESDLVEEGRQYQIAVRADPTSGASMLSVTIQASMLLGRVLDLPDRVPTLAGSKGFLFTDDLDVTNRLFHDLKDAEGDGWTARRRPGAHKVLANLRSTALPDRARRDGDGQVWTLVERIGHMLPGTYPARGLRIGKTSSQDPGVADAADLVVATASLDVGFNDPRVGLIVQHKSPRDPAQFVQRRGRAGRTRQVRPLTTIVLSDFGRDRLTYQAYDRLFDPELPPRALPVGNRYVLRMQATFVLKDWLTRQLQWRYDAREVLSAKTGKGHAAAEQMAILLERLLTDPLAQREFGEYLRWSLQLDDDDILAVLWDPPRALLTAVVPTLLRRVRSNWTPVDDDPGGVGDSYAPEFAPRALFAPLNLPEVELLLPAVFLSQVDSRMAVSQALRETAPGRVSKRFAVRSGAQRTWVPVPLDVPSAVLPLRDFVDQGSAEGVWTDDASGEQYTVVRPYSIRVDEPLPAVADSANSRPSWRTQMVPHDGPAARLEVPEPWAAHVEHLSVHTHANRRPLQVRRFTPGATASLKVRGNRTGAAAPAQTRLSYATHDGRPAALGFALDVDGLQLRLRLPDSATLLALPHLSTPSWRSRSFRHAVAADESMDPVADNFVRLWLGPVFESAIALRTLTHDEPVAEACATVTKEELRTAVGRLTGILGGDSDPTDTLLDQSDDDPRHLRVKLLTALDAPTTTDRLRDHARRLHRLTAADADLARRVLGRTVGAAVYTAALCLVPDATEQDLVLDLHVDGDGADVWLTESTVGGAGVIEKVVKTYVNDPRRFWRLVWATLRRGDFEVVDSELRRLLAEVVTTPAGPVAAALARVRQATDNAMAREAWHELRCELDDNGYLVSHPVISAIAIRLLRPGTSERHDVAMLNAIQRWEEATRAVGFEIDARTWSYLVLDRHADEVGDVYRTSDQVYSSLWPRGSEAFNRDLEVPATYEDLPPPLDRQLVAGLVVDDVAEVLVTDNGWRAAYEDVVTIRGVVDLVAPTEAAATLQQAVLSVSTNPIDTGYLFVHPVVRGARREKGRLKVRLELREVEQ
jgi:ATP-dependent helicase Lhr and Lhr-like helicase